MTTRYIVQYTNKSILPEWWTNYNFHEKREHALWLCDELNKLQTTKQFLINYVYRVVERTEKVINK